METPSPRLPGSSASNPISQSPCARGQACPLPDTGPTMEGPARLQPHVPCPGTHHGADWGTRCRGYLNLQTQGPSRLESPAGL